jgi:hypothetical protein
LNPGHRRDGNTCRIEQRTGRRYSHAEDVFDSEAFIETGRWRTTRRVPIDLRRLPEKSPAHRC